MINAVSMELSDACGNDPGFICEWIWDNTENEKLSEIISWIIERPLKVVVILLVAMIVNRLLRRAIDRMVQRIISVREQEQTEAELESEKALSNVGERARRRLQRISEHGERSRQRALTLGAVLRGTSTTIVYLMGLMIALGEIGLDLGPLLAGAGIVGLAIGFGAQSLVADFIAGVFVIIEDQYGVGDWVDVGSDSGSVERVSLSKTVLRDAHGTVWVVPNGEIRRVGNSSQLWARTVLDLEVAYDTDIDKAATIIKDVADQLWEEQLEVATILEEPVVSGVQSFGADSIAIRLSVKTEPGEQWSTGRILRARIKKAFDTYGIEIPFPQRTVWMHTADNSGKEKEVPEVEIKRNLLEGSSGSSDED